jgi:hypothetical protein
VLDNKNKHLITKPNEKSFPMSTKANFSSVIDSSSFSKSKPNETNQGEEEVSSIYSECLVVSMFFNPDNGLLVYDSYPRGEIYSKLISVRIPYHFFVTKVF